MVRSYTGSDLGADALYFLPLGGTGEIGMNLNLYGHKGAWLMVDLGITFADERLPGVDVLMPDPAFIEERREDLAGLVLTHAHEDHIGAVPYIWPKLRCPVYATGFTAALLRRKLAEFGLLDEVPLTEVPLSGKFSVGPFDIELITLTHSIPEPNAVVIRTDAGSVLHTGDWKLDPDPLVGDDFDEARLKALADEDVLAMIGDSTNAMVAGEAGSEGAVRDRLRDVIGGLKQRVAVACFASNVARLETIIKVAEESGRRVCLLGRSMHRIVECARESGYLKGHQPFLSEDEIDYLPRNEVLLLCTGSQGEPRAALWRIARGDHPAVALDKGDAVVFSSRVIPGNETKIFELQNALVESGVEIIDDRNHDIHVSGHPGRDELIQMYQWVRPRIAVPVHGERRHLAAHAQIAKECQIPQQIVGQNGAMIQLAPGEARIIDQVPSGRLAYEGRRLLPVNSSVIKGRQKMVFNGAAAVTLVLDERGQLDGDPEISTAGLFEPGEEDEILTEVEAAISHAVQRLGKRERRDDSAVREAAQQALRRTVNRLLGKKPVTMVHVIRFE
ncbi:ribonuclease J [Pelagibius litoralis]|uniref:Ribonuclease J n=1 Tax=Pelagibius litoralis TaxID=374515 RepID=A0A967C2R5_9PROT|nr:ribonuclease J [Pelagibius litoralis]NIA67284.1 ribonuclease J [Pelagibius litoralis]